MPTWGQILGEIRSLIGAGDKLAFDTVRNKYLKELSAFTGRDTIIYATRWTSGDVPPNLVTITDEDVHAFMEAVSGLKCDNHAFGSTNTAKIIANQNGNCFLKQFNPVPLPR